MTKKTLKSELTEEELKFIPTVMYKIGLLQEKKAGFKKRFPLFEPGSVFTYPGQHFIDAGTLSPIEYFDKNPDKLQNKIYSMYRVIPETGEELFFYESNPSQKVPETHTFNPNQSQGTSGLNDRFDPEKAYQENERLKADLHQKELDSLKNQNELLKASHSPENINALENYFKESLNFYREENRNLKEQINKLFEERILDKGDYEQELSKIKLEYEQKLYEAKGQLAQCEMGHKEQLFKKEREYQKDIDHHKGLNDALIEANRPMEIVKSVLPELAKNPDSIRQIVDVIRGIFGKGGTPGVNVNQSNFNPNPNQYHTPQMQQEVPQNGNQTRPPMFVPRIELDDSEEGQ
jgi:hypothetical protein